MRNTQETETKLADIAIRKTHKRLISLKRWYLSMVLKTSMVNASLLFAGGDSII